MAFPAGAELMGCMLHTSQSELFALNVSPWFSPLDGRNLSPVDQVTSQVHSGREGSGTELPEWRREKPLWQGRPQPMVGLLRATLQGASVLPE